MAIRNVVLNGDSLLRKKSRDVTVFDEKLWELLDDMRETMEKNDGVGLAAVQVGILRRVVVIDVDGFAIDFVNPTIMSSNGKQCMQEGCLSVPSRVGYVNRPYCVTVKAQNRYGISFSITLRDFPAVVICHEIDHLNGILFIDKIVDEPIVKKEK